MSLPFKALSLDERMIETNNRASGFDYLRLFLSLSVILWHSHILSYGQDAQDQLEQIFRVPARAILICFFSLSGFLVAGSLWRCKTLFSFVGLRIIRIVPALFLEVTISALILGPIVTTLTLSEYFSSRQFHSYFLNIIGSIHYYLPGVFTSNPIPGVVNGQLWTIPVELKCYLALIVMTIFGIVMHKFNFLLLLAVTQLFFGLTGFVAPDSRNDFINGNNLIMAFLYGVSFYAYKERILYSKWLLAAATFSSCFLLYFEKGGYFAALPLTYITIYVGLLNPKKIKLIKSGDYSYGIYLYGFPFQQLVANFGGGFHHWIINFIVSLFLAGWFAYFSWNYIELPFSKFRTKLLLLEEKYIYIKNIVLGFIYKGYKLIF